MVNGEKNSILIVDDETTNIEVLLSILGDDYIIYMSRDGASAVEMAEKFAPDLILLDIIMPDMNGHEVFLALKKSERTKNIPVIFITGLDSVQDEEKALALEAVDFIRKPFSATVVTLRVKNQIQSINQLRMIEQYAKRMETIVDILAATEEKSKFFAKMSHEMRTPLNAIIGISEMILEADSINDEMWGDIEKINSAGSSLLSMVNDILDIGKIESGKFKLVPVEYNTFGMINDAVSQSIMQKGSKKIAFTLNIDENIPARLYGDDIRIKQILNNLLSNAFKYTKEGKVDLDINSETIGGSVWLNISVTDTGVGIKSENINSMFLDFSRMDSKSNRNIVGTGLGLSITKMLVDMMGGSVLVKSEYGKGSCFTVRFPQKSLTDEVIGSNLAENLKNQRIISRKEKQKRKQSRITLPYARVLIVDDVLTNLHVIKGMMKPYKMQVDCVESGKEAVDAVRGEKVKYNVIFMDHMMPEMDGIEAARIIREEIGTEYAKKIPIVAFTANALAGNEKMFLSKGFQAFLTKPVQIGPLDDVIRKWVRNEELEKSWQSKKAESDNGVGYSENARVLDDFFDEEIEGMDISKGLERFGGDKSTFLQLLKTFTANTRHLLEKMREVTENNLKDYAVHVHGVKSSCRGICAEEIGARAETLEEEAKAGGFDYVKNNNPAFIEDVIKLIENVENALSKYKIGEEPKEKLKRSTPYKEALANLKTACEEFKTEDIEAAMKEIDCFDYTADDGLVLWLRENAALMNYAEIAEKLSSLV